jgi:CRISPR/Cas system-associated exonuclease Cas4 (RecB family)
MAMHASVEDMWRVMKDRNVDIKFLLDSYKKNLGLLGILSEREFNEALLRGEKSLKGWFAWSKPAYANLVMPEFKISAVELAPNIMLSGNLDKVEIISSRKAIVTDYKTGKQKSRNEIEGKTKNSNGDMKRQLEFYALLLKLHDDMKMEKGIIEFLEPNESGKYTRQEFEISNEEISALTETIKRAVKEITTLAFWNKKCSDKKCEYCKLREIISR